MQTKQYISLRKYFHYALILFFLYPCVILAQVADSSSIKKDSLFNKPSSADTAQIRIDSIKTNSIVIDEFQSPIEKVLNKTKFLNTKATAISTLQKERKAASSDINFYWIAITFLMLGVLKVSFSKYFSNLIRVFFNTSLRQSQLTDQLLQSKLPSLFFNLFFINVSGLYLFHLLNWYQKFNNSQLDVLLYCMLAVTGVYFTKYIALHLAGWLIGYKKDVETYIFIVFLLNKILAILLLPLVAIIAFAEPAIKNTAIILSFFLIGIMLILRYLRAFALLQHNLKVSKFHFFLYIFAIEIMPIFLIYKWVLNFLTKS